MAQKVRFDKTGIYDDGYFDNKNRAGDINDIGTKNIMLLRRAVKENIPIIELPNVTTHKDIIKVNGFHGADFSVIRLDALVRVYLRSRKVLNEKEQEMIKGIVGLYEVKIEFANQFVFGSECRATIWKLNRELYKPTKGRKHDTENKF